MANTTHSSRLPEVAPPVTVDRTGEQEGPTIRLLLLSALHRLSLAQGIRCFRPRCRADLRLRCRQCLHELQLACRNLALELINLLHRTITLVLMLLSLTDSIRRALMLSACNGDLPLVELLLLQLLQVLVLLLVQLLGCGLPAALRFLRLRLQSLL